VVDRTEGERGQKKDGVPAENCQKTHSNEKLTKQDTSTVGGILKNVGGAGVGLCKQESGDVDEQKRKTSGKFRGPKT